MNQTDIRLITDSNQPEDRVTFDILRHLDICRLEVTRHLEESKRSSLGQFITPSSVARIMASMVEIDEEPEVKLLDPGAGIGTLFAACVEALCLTEKRPKNILITAYEIEPIFQDYLKDTINLCKSMCKSYGVGFNAIVLQEDFVAAAVSALREDMFSTSLNRFTHAILNPPYHKVQTGSKVRKMLSSIGIETSNLYTAFLSLTAFLLEKNGQMVSITPRSFCNGLYFKPFRKQFLTLMNIERLHLFQSRTEAFREDDVLQENLIMSAVKDGMASSKILISSSVGAEDDGTSVREVDRTEVVDPKDDDSFIHIVTDELENRIAKLASRFESTLEGIGLEVSTGRVVDFRATEFILQKPRADSVPLIYPAHFVDGYVRWPISGIKKPNAILVTQETQDQLIPSQNYVLVKRFSSKEERKRIVAAVYDAGRIPTNQVGFENHLNYFHKNHEGLNLDIAKGLAAYLNSTIVDTIFRHFSGHTQVNAVDLRKLPYPDLSQLEKVGKNIAIEFPAQEELDRIIEKEILVMSEADKTDNPISAKSKIEEALAVLKALGFPRAQLNERSALTLLSLLDLKPDSRWSDAGNPMRGITPMMEFFAHYYGKNYKPNTRETVRRQTVHQFLQAGLIVENPDDPSRPTNSPKAVYQIETGALELLRTFGNPEWNRNVRTYLMSRQTLAEKYAREREMKRIPVSVANGSTLSLSPGGQNILIKQVIEEFASRFTPGGQLVYVGDTGEKFACFDDTTMKKLGVKIEAHGKMPDVIIYQPKKNWLVLIEAVTSHGPMNPKRREELKKLFEGCSAGLVFVTAFLTRKAMMEYLSEISWETEVWVAEAPSHLIHFNGERFLGPYDS